MGDYERAFGSYGGEVVFIALPKERMMETELIITEIIEKRFAHDRASTYLKCRLSDDRKIAFWCDDCEAGENIRMIERATLPLLVDLADYVSCAASPYERSKYGLAYSVPELVDISVESLAE